jgi:hypothetical protein
MKRPLSNWIAMHTKELRESAPNREQQTMGTSSLRSNGRRNEGREVIGYKEQAGNESRGVARKVLNQELALRLEAIPAENTESKYQSEKCQEGTMKCFPP